MQEPGVAYDVAEDLVPLRVFKGKRFSWAWELADSPTGDVTSLEDVLAIEIKARLKDTTDEPYTWSMTTNHVTISNDEFVLVIPTTETDDMAVGFYDTWISYGTVEDEPDTVILKGVMEVESIP